MPVVRARGRSSPFSVMNSNAWIPAFSPLANAETKTMGPARADGMAAMESAATRRGENEGFMEWVWVGGWLEAGG